MLRVLNTWMALAGNVLIALASTLITFVIYTYFSVLYPVLAPTWGLLKYLHLVIAFTLVFNIAFNYYRVVTVSPGYPPLDAVCPESPRFLLCCGMQLSFE
jgi:hypothetical protein